MIFFSRNKTVNSLFLFYPFGWLLVFLVAKALLFESPTKHTVIVAFFFIYLRKG